MYYLLTILAFSDSANFATKTIRSEIQERTIRAHDEFVPAPVRRADENDDVLGAVTLVENV